jgi:hypothetical protein
MIVGVDDSLKPYTCYPQGIESSQKRESIKVAEDLDQAVELDSILGREEFVAYFCNDSFGKEQAYHWAKSSGDDPLPEGCVRRSVVLQKKPSEAP